MTTLYSEILCLDEAPFFWGKLEEDTVKVFLIHSFIHLFSPFLSSVLYLCIQQMSTYHGIYVEVRGTTFWSWFTPSPYKFLTSVSCHQDSWQAILPTESSHHFSLPSFLSIFWLNLNTYLVVANSPPLFFLPLHLLSFPLWHFGCSIFPSVLILHVLSFPYTCPLTSLCSHGPAI